MARPTFDATLDELTYDPHPVLAAMRAQGAVVFVPALNGWVVTTRSLALEVMRDPVTFTVDHPGFTTGQVVGPSMLSLDGAEHSRHREPFLSYYRASVVRDELGAWMTAEAERQVAALAPQGSADLRSEFAAPFAAAVIAESLGLADTPVDAMVGWYVGIVDAVGALSAGDEPGVGGHEAMIELADAVRRTIDAEPSSMLGRVHANASLSIDEIVSNVAVLMFGAIETAEAMIANALWFLLRDESALAAVRGDRGLLANAIEESLRLEPAATRVDRYVTRPVSLGGGDIPTGELVIVSIAAAGRDPRDLRPARPIQGGASERTPTLGFRARATRLHRHPSRASRSPGRSQCTPRRPSRAGLCDRKPTSEWPRLPKTRHIVCGVDLGLSVRLPRDASRATLQDTNRQGPLDTEPVARYPSASAAAFLGFMTGTTS